MAIQSECMFCAQAPCVCDKPAKRKLPSKKRAADASSDKASRGDSPSAVRPTPQISQRGSLTRGTSTILPASVQKIRPVAADLQALTKVEHKNPLDDLDDELIVCLHVLSPILHSETRYNLRSVLLRTLTPQQGLIMWRKSYAPYSRIQAKMADQHSPQGDDELQGNAMDSGVG